MVYKIELGLCNPPEPIYLYVDRGEINGEKYVWYRYNNEQDTKTAVQYRGLTGYVTELRVTTKEFRGQDNKKLNIFVSADEIYVVRTGIETNFAKTFLLAASQVQDFSKPLIIAATPGEENVVFCRLYDPATKIRIQRKWNPNADWEGIIQDIQSKLDCNSESFPEAEDYTDRLALVS
ncbi:hypothetical protein I8752_01235 [Nostocaceae cyanobacterium CENA369]|uniref:Uncharacterized protein n=1 Tax=Dendronalium phyllosphericum CENA369 TaxID=1725256 RepID=A0A8J7I1M3_9NOST|nr:hypothetical protein [Dendronalium phyllosphericum]MBH8571670.1 hypothetical protein [Dendronalium phyllosphericum CENA369]